MGGESPLPPPGEEEGEMPEETGKGTPDCRRGREEVVIGW